jgi:hypothetical protein
MAIPVLLDILSSVGMTPIEKRKDGSEPTLESEVNCCLVIAMASLQQEVRAVPVRGRLPQSPSAGSELL